MNQVNLIGRLVADVNLRFVPGSGIAVANFTLAIDKGLSREKKQEFENQGKPTADFPRVTVWGKQAENCSQYLAKGRLCAITGSIQTSSYKTDAGETRYTTDVLANRVEFLEWGKKEGQENTGWSKDDDFSFGDFESVDTDDVPWK